jgi:hypothetical protein
VNVRTNCWMLWREKMKVDWGERERERVKI